MLLGLGRDHVAGLADLVLVGDLACLAHALLVGQIAERRRLPLDLVERLVARLRVGRAVRIGRISGRRRLRSGEPLLEFGDLGVQLFELRLGIVRLRNEQRAAAGDDEIRRGLGGALLSGLARAMQEIVLLLRQVGALGLQIIQLLLEIRDDALGRAA